MARLVFEVPTPESGRCNHERLVILKTSSGEDIGVRQCCDCGSTLFGLLQAEPKQDEALEGV